MGGTPKLVTGRWEDLARELAPALARIPKTGLDPTAPADWSAVHAKSVTYLQRNVVGQPWADHLALLAAVLSAQRLDPTTVYRALQVLHNRFLALLPALGLSTMAGWRGEPEMRRYLQRAVCPDHSLAMRHNFWLNYCSVTRHTRRWLDGLPDEDRPRYQAFVLPVIDPHRLDGLNSKEVLLDQRRQARKIATDAVVPHFAALRAQAHLRFNRLTRLREKYHEALAHLDRAGGAALPLDFSYEEGADPERGVPAQERWHFRLWDRRSFVLAHAAGYSQTTVLHARTGQLAFAADRNRRFLEFVRAERLTDGAEPAGLWFAELLRLGMLGHRPQSGDSAARQAWLRQWGYEDPDGRPVSPFVTAVPGLLSWSRDSGQYAFLPEAQERTGGVLLEVEPLYAAAAFGLLAVNLFTTTGMRMNEAMQVNLGADCLVRLVSPAPPGAADPAPRVRYLFRLLPKGERTERRHDYFFGEETKRVLHAVGQLLTAHYGAAAGAPLPVVAFDPRNARAHRFAPAPYIFQFAGRHIGAISITSCLRFLLHGLTFLDRAGAVVVLNAHLLRHAFATHAVHVERIPLDIVGIWLKQKDLRVTAYYSAPTAGIVADAADRFLTRIAHHLDVQEAVRRSPEELRRQYADALTKVGTLTEVPGGHCTMHGFCPAQFACVGCSMKVPDPAKRQQVEHKRAWGQDMARYSTAQGLLPEAERMKQLVRDCEIELAEMDQIAAYRRDEGYAPPIHIVPARPGGDTPGA